MIIPILSLLIASTAAGSTEPGRLRGRVLFLQDDCRGPFSSDFSSCEDRIVWLTENYLQPPSSHMYLAGGVDGSRCSAQRYLSTRENFCPPVLECKGPFPDAFATCANRIFFKKVRLMANYLTSIFSHNYLAGGVDGSRPPVDTATASTPADSTSTTTSSTTTTTSTSTASTVATTPASTPNTAAITTTTTTSTKHSLLNWYRRDASAVGEWGGICECPDGSRYEVGDNKDSCATLACEGEGAKIVVGCGQGVISSSNAQMRVTCGVAPPTCGNPDSTSVIVASQNLFWWNLFNRRGGGNFFNVFKSHGPFDILLLQECDDVHHVVKGLGLDGCFAADQGAHAVSIAWNNVRFERIGSGTQDVGVDRPEQFFGSRGVVWARLRERASGSVFFAVSHHGPLPINTGGTGGGASVAANIKAVIAQHAGAEDTVLMGGDFNAGVGSATVQGLEGTFDLVRSDWVDHMFVSAKGGHVVDSSVIRDTGSDHRGLKLRFQMN